MKALSLASWASICLAIPSITWAGLKSPLRIRAARALALRKQCSGRKSAIRVLRLQGLGARLFLIPLEETDADERGRVGAGVDRWRRDRGELRHDHRQVEGGAHHVETAPAHPAFDEEDQPAHHQVR